MWASFDSDLMMKDMVTEHMQHLRESLPNLGNLSGTYKLQLGSDRQVRNVYMFDAWYSSSEDEMEVADTFNLTQNTEPLLQVTRSGKDYQRKDLDVPESSLRKSGSALETGKEIVEVKEDLVTDQLKKMKANASIWDLLVYSHSHRRALIDALSKIQVPKDVSPENMVGLMMEKKPEEITFTDEDLPLEGRDHNKALYIAAEVNGKRTSCVMVDDGSAINVCPSKLLPKLGVSATDLQSSDLVIRAYDNSKRNVEGTFMAKVKVGPIESEICITVLDIPMSFIVLQGRP